MKDALATLRRMRGEAVDDLTAGLDLSQRLRGPPMSIPISLQAATSDAILHISSTLGAKRTRFWSKRRTLLAALYVHALQDEGPAATVGGNVVALRPGRR